MKRVQIVLLFVSALTLQCRAAAVAEDQKTDPREKLDTTIDWGIGLLEKKKYKELIEDFCHPEDLKNLRRVEKVNDVVVSLQGKKGQVLLDVLKNIKMKQPRYNSDKTKAIFPVDVEDAPQEEITFEKLEKHWYLRN